MTLDRSTPAGELPEGIPGWHAAIGLQSKSAKPFDRRDDP
ncbi:hypothetical protein CHELA1G11_13238 [Hyphomicrobiales bacterium]|nr:hypothetical protein CHELA1G11_13238 [Hyphomicrobiales bacterium]